MRTRAGRQVVPGAVNRAVRGNSSHTAGAARSHPPEASPRARPAPPGAVASVLLQVEPVAVAAAVAPRDGCSIPAPSGCPRN